MLVAKYLLGELSGADLEDFDIHLFECSICAEQVKAGQEFTANIPAVLPCDEPGPMQWWRRIKKVWGQRKFWRNA